MGLKFLSFLFGGNNNDGSEDNIISDDYKIIDRFFLSESGYCAGFSYEITEDDEDMNKRILLCNNRKYDVEEFALEVNEDLIKEISLLCKKHHVNSWNKFKEVNSHMLDGKGFSFSVQYADGTVISASGENSFPSGYNNFANDIQNLLQPLLIEEVKKINEKRYNDGYFGKPLESAFMQFRGRGKSGSDVYVFFLRNYDDLKSVSAEVESHSGIFIEKGNYKYSGQLENIDELLAHIQSVVDKYKIYKWMDDELNDSDYNNLDYFQFAFQFPQANISCNGCGIHPDYQTVKRELIQIVLDYIRFN